MPHFFQGGPDFLLSLAVGEEGAEFCFHCRYEDVAHDIAFNVEDAVGWEYGLGGLVEFAGCGPRK